MLLPITRSCDPSTEVEGVVRVVEGVLPVAVVVVEEVAEWPGRAGGGGGHIGGGPFAWLSLDRCFLQGSPPCPSLSRLNGERSADVDARNE